MRKLMEKLQKQSQAMKSTQQEISSLKKQLSETTGFFKGKARKSLEGKIEQAEKQEKRIHTDMEQTVKQAGYPDVQSFGKQVIIRIFKSLPAFDKMFSNDGGDTNRDGWQ